MSPKQKGAVVRLIKQASGKGDPVGRPGGFSKWNRLPQGKDSFLRVASPFFPGILLSRKPPTNPGMTAGFWKRTMVGKNGESTPRSFLVVPYFETGPCGPKTTMSTLGWNTKLKEHQVELYNLELLFGCPCWRCLFWVYFKGNQTEATHVLKLLQRHFKGRGSVRLWISTIHPAVE